MPMTLAEIRETLEHISDEWRSGTAGERKMDLADLDDLLGQLDDLESDAATDTETLGELRGRIEVLMDEIDISLGIEPAPPFRAWQIWRRNPRTKTRYFRKANKSTTDLGGSTDRSPRHHRQDPGHAAMVSCPKGWNEPHSLLRIVGALLAWGWVGPAGCWLNRSGPRRPPNVCFEPAEDGRHRPAEPHTYPGHHGRLNASVAGHTWRAVTAAQARTDGP